MDEKIEWKNDGNRWKDAIDALLDATPKDRRVARNPFLVMKIIETTVGIPDATGYGTLFKVLQNDRRKSKLVRALKKLKHEVVDSTENKGPEFYEYVATTLEWVAHRNATSSHFELGIKAIKLLSRINYPDKESRLERIKNAYLGSGFVDSDGFKEKKFRKPKQRKLKLETGPKIKRKQLQGS